MITQSTMVVSSEEGRGESGEGDGEGGEVVVNGRIIFESGGEDGGIVGGVKMSLSFSTVVADDLDDSSTRLAISANGLSEVGVKAAGVWFNTFSKIKSTYPALLEGLKWKQKIQCFPLSDVINFEKL
ncbi:hypothetical protein Tco_0184916 [Tanacetum coccineum]